MVTFSEPFAGWRDLFGGFYFLLPSHLLEGKNRHKVMKDGYAFSGGPWMLEGGKDGWEKGKSITLVPNPKYWGTKPPIGEGDLPVHPRERGRDQGAEDRPGPRRVPDCRRPGCSTSSTRPNLKYHGRLRQPVRGVLAQRRPAFPLDSKAVRQALLYATDRQAIVDQILKPAVREGRVLQSFIVPTFTQYFAPTFSEYSQDPAKVEQLMTGDGWAKGYDGIWAKDGQQGVVRDQHDVRQRGARAHPADLAEPARQAGFDLEIKNVERRRAVRQAGLPKGGSASACTRGRDTRPRAVRDLLLGEHPDEGEQVLGDNCTRLDDAAIDQPWTAADAELDDRPARSPA